MRLRLEGPSDSQIYRVTEAKLFVPAIWLRVRNTTAPSCATSGRRGALPCGHPGPAGAGAPGRLLQHGNKRGAFYTTARTVAQVRRGCERTGSRSLLMNCSWLIQTGRSRRRRSRSSRMTSGLLVVELGWRELAGGRARGIDNVRP